MKHDEFTALIEPEDNWRQQITDLVAFSGTCKEIITVDELMQLREHDLPEDARLYSH